MCLNVNYHESKELGEDYNISFPIGYYPDYNMELYCIVTEKNPHIILYHGSISNADKCTRISLLSTEYIIASDSDIDNWVLTKEEKDKLISILQSRSSMSLLSRYNLSVWEYIIKLYNNEMEYINESKIIPNDSQIPDYTKL